MAARDKLNGPGAAAEGARARNWTGALGAAGALELKGLFPSCTFNWFCESSGFCTPLVGWVGSGARVESPLAGSWILSTTLVWRLYI